MQFSDNGWPGIEDRADTERSLVPGTSWTIQTAPGAAWILTEFTRRFNKEVEPIAGNQLDDWSYAWRPVRGSTKLSCHASGTAVDLNALIHPRGVRGTLDRKAKQRLRVLLDEFTDFKTGQVVIKWGGDFGYPSIVDEMHFQIRGDQDALDRVKTRLTQVAEEEDDMSFKERHVLTEADVAAYGSDELEPGKDSKSYDELLRFPPGVARLRREMVERDKKLSAQIVALQAAVAELAKK